MKSIDSYYQESTSLFKKKSSDFCEGCVVHGMYDKSKKGCLYCKDLNSNKMFLFNSNSMKYNKFFGFYDSIFSAISKDYQSQSSAGGFTSHLIKNLLQKRVVDAVISVAYCKKDQKFTYKEFTVVDSLNQQQKSAYVKVNLLDAIEIIKKTDKNFAITATPVACKILRLYQRKNPIIRSRLKLIIGLVSGGYKNDQYIPFLFSIMKEKKYSKFKSIAFRKKIKNLDYSGNNYFFEAKDCINQSYNLKADQIKGNWPLGLFKYFASDFCDDTFNVNADVTIMDGWHKKFKTTYGASLVILRNKNLNQIIYNDKNLNISPESADVILDSQAGGLRHKTVGLNERLRIYSLLGYPIPNFIQKRKLSKFEIIQFLIQINRLVSSHLSKKIYQKFGYGLLFKIMVSMCFLINRLLSKMYALKNDKKKIF